LLPEKMSYPITRTASIYSKLTGSIGI